MGKKEIPFVEGLKELVSSKAFMESIPRISPYSTEELLDLFIEKNDLPGIKSKQRTGLGISVVLEDDSQFIIKSEQVGGLRGVLNPELEPYIGGSEEFRHTSVKTRYFLSGEIEGIGLVELKAEMSTSTKYRLKKPDGPPSFGRYPVRESEEPKVYTLRKDSYPLWFIKDAREAVVLEDSDSEQISLGL